MLVLRLGVFTFSGLVALSAAALQLPTDITAEATSANGAIVAFTAAGSGGGEDDDGRPTTKASCSPSSGATFALGRTVVTCTSGSESGSFVVNVVDTTAPMLRIPRDFTFPTTSTDGAVVTFTTSAHDLVDGERSVTCTPASGSFFAIGETRVQCTSADSRNNASTGDFVVSVNASTPPPGPPPDMTVEATGPDGAVVTFNVPGNNGGDDDNGRPGNAANCSPSSGSTFPLGETRVQCSVGNFDITVVDTTAPALTLPDDLVSTHAVVTFTTSASDLVDGNVAVTCAPPSGSTFAQGTTAVVCTATDAHNNTATGSFTVTFTPTTSDSEAPVIHSLTATPNVLWPPNGNMVGIVITANVTDNLDPAPYVAVYDITVNETHDSTDYAITAPLTVQLRAKRNGNGDGRVYTIHVEAIDSAGNRTTGTVTVTVPHDQGNKQTKRRAA